MLKKCNDSVLISEGLDQQFVLFYQAWLEQTETKTFDTYQYKSFNVLNGLSEVIHNISVFLDGTTKTDHSIVSSCDELKKTVGTDGVLSTYFPRVKSSILSAIGKKCDTTGKLKALRYQLQTYWKCLQTEYDGKLAELLADHICSGASDVLILTEKYISRCVDLGWSEKALHSKVSKLKGMVGSDTHTVIKEFLDKLISAPKQSFSVFIPYRIKVMPNSGKTKEDSTVEVHSKLEQLGIRVCSIDEIKSNDCKVDITKLKSDKYLIKTVSAYDIYSASHQAMREVSRVLSMLSFFSAIESAALHTTVWAVCNNNVPYTATVGLNQLYGTYEYLDSSSTVFTRILSLMNSDDGSNGDMLQKVHSSFSFASLSRVSTSLEEKYMNMWIALESLCLTDSSDNIISSIKNAVTDAVCLRYLHRLVRNFVDDCNRCDVSLVFETITIDPREANKDTVVSSMINLMRTTTEYAELKERCSVNTLLLKRCEIIHDMLCNYNNMREFVRNHHNTVSWHLDRLYRIRNEIAHAATTQSISTIRYIEHLYDYLATLISETSRLAKKHNSSNMGEVFSLISDNYREFEEIASAKKLPDPTAQLGKFWTHGIIDFI